MEKRNCRACGTTFRCSKPPRGPSPYYCSDDCRKVAARGYAQKNRAKRGHIYNATRRMEFKEQACDRCHGTFTPKRKDQRFCSPRCERAGSRGPRVVADTDHSQRPPDQHLGSYYRALSGDPCPYCGRPSEQRDHIIPRSRGGINSWENYSGICAPCNGRKGNSSVLVYMLSRPLLEQIAEARAKLRLLPRGGG